MKLSGSQLNDNAQLTLKQNGGYDTYVRVFGGENGKAVRFGWGSGMVNHGIFDDQLGRWVVQCTSDAAWFNGLADSALYLNPTDNQSDTVFAKSLWNVPCIESTAKKVWGNRFYNKTFSNTDSGDIVFFLRDIPDRKAQELNVAIDGYFYQKGGTYKVLDKSDVAWTLIKEVTSDSGHMRAYVNTGIRMLHIVMRRYSVTSTGTLYPGITIPSDYKPASLSTVAPIYRTFGNTTLVMGGVGIFADGQVYLEISATGNYWGTLTTIY